jgi:hypothetical protein
VTENEQISKRTTSTMTGRERLHAALTGQEPDRVCIWLREGFNPLGRPASADHFRLGWQADPLYHQLHQIVSPWADDFSFWGIPGNRFCMASRDVIQTRMEEQTPELTRTRTTIPTGKGDLHSIVERHRNEATQWVIKPMVTSVEELEMLASVEFEVGQDHIVNSVDAYARAVERLGPGQGAGLCRLGLSSPMVCISGSMHLELFLELTHTHRDLIRGLCHEMTERILHLLGRIWDEADRRGIQIRGASCLGGSEQCTPPMMAPEMYDELVVPHDGRIIQWLSRRGLIPTVHCHGKVRHALKGMLEMGVQGTDPVEPPPAGDVTYAQAREIVGDRMTLIGNLEFDELEFAEPAHIRKRVKEILSFGRRRLILSASAGPITHVTPRLVDNYRAMIDAALEFGC